MPTVCAVWQNACNGDCVQNALTVDLEDYFHVTAFAEHVGSEEWNIRESRLQRNSEKLLEILAAAQTHATFFVLGWVARKYPEIVRTISDAGHELACHSDSHRQVFHLSRTEFFQDTLTAKEAIESASGRQVRGYRAPSFSITRHSWWALEVLAELNFTYDSSVYPVAHPSYGVPESSRFPYIVDTRAGRIVEFPMSTMEFLGLRSPIAGGAYFRLLPYWYTAWSVRHLNKVEQAPVCVYLHPWELDPGQPRIRGRLSSKVRHYIGLRSVERKLRTLMSDFQFSPLGQLVTNFTQRNLDLFTFRQESLASSI